MWRCELCTKSFFHSHSAWKHYREEHVQRKFICGECADEFRAKSSFDRHWTTEHRQHIRETPRFLDRRFELNDASNGVVNKLFTITKLDAKESIPPNFARRPRLSRSPEGSRRLKGPRSPRPERTRSRSPKQGRPHSRSPRRGRERTRSRSPRRERERERPRSRSPRRERPRSRSWSPSPPRKGNPFSTETSRQPCDFRSPETVQSSLDPRLRTNCRSRQDVPPPADNLLSVPRMAFAEPNENQYYIAQQSATVCEPSKSPKIVLRRAMCESTTTTTTTTSLHQNVAVEQPSSSRESVGSIKSEIDDESEPENTTVTSESTDNYSDDFTNYAECCEKYKQGIVICPVCRTRLAHRQALIMHMTMIHGTSKLPTYIRGSIQRRMIRMFKAKTCVYCNNQYETLYKIRSHLIKRHQVTIYQCAKAGCSFATSSEATMMRHEMKHGEMDE